MTNITDQGPEIAGQVSCWRDEKCFVGDVSYHHYHGLLLFQIHVNGC